MMIAIACRRVIRYFAIRHGECCFVPHSYTAAGTLSAFGSIACNYAARHGERAIVSYTYTAAATATIVSTDSVIFNYTASHCERYMILDKYAAAVTIGFANSLVARNRTTFHGEYAIV
jgi:hypothetical protein